MLSGSCHRQRTVFHLRGVRDEIMGVKDALKRELCSAEPAAGISIYVGDVR